MGRQGKALVRASSTGADEHDGSIDAWRWAAVIWTAVTIVFVVELLAHASTWQGQRVDVQHLLSGLGGLWVLGMAATHTGAAVIAGHNRERRAIDRSYRQLFEALPDPTFVLEWRDGVFGAVHEVNEAACTLLGVDREDVLASSLCDLFDGYTTDLVTSTAKEVEQAEGLVVEHRLTTRDGTRPVRAEFHRFESAGRPSVLLILQDLGDRRAAEWALRRLDSQLTGLSSATRRINQDLREATILRTLGTSAMEVLGATRGMTGLLRDGRVEFGEYVDLDGRHDLSLSLPVMDCVVDSLWDSLAVVRSNDAPREWPRHPSFAEHFQPISLLAAPIIGQDGSFLGCIEVHDKVGGEPFSEADGLVILGLASSAAVALANARLLEGQNTMRHELLEREGRLRRLAAELSRTEERERRRIAEGLHDHIGQELAVMRMQLGRLRASTLDASGTEAVAAIGPLLDQAIADTRALTFEVSPPMLYTLGLGAALEWLCERLEQQHALTVALADEVRGQGVSDDARALLYISVRELLMNVVKHARATTVEVRMTVVRERLRVVVRDDGVGFSAEEARRSQGGFGLFSIAERLRGVSGEMTIRSRPGQGAEVVLEVPLQADA